MRKASTPEDFLRAFSQSIFREEGLRRFFPAALFANPKGNGKPYISTNTETRLSDVYAPVYDTFYSYSKEQQAEPTMQYDRLFYVLSFDDREQDQSLDCFIYLKDLSKRSFPKTFFKIEELFVLRVGYRIEDSEELERNRGLQPMNLLFRNFKNTRGIHGRVVLPKIPL